MGKDKKRSNEESSQKETTFYHEVIGIITIIISLVILGKLGRIGLLLTNLFKILFGDCYWIVIFFFVFFGLYNLFKHKKFDFKNQRFIGFCCFLIGILMFAHFPLHRYVEEIEGSYFGTTWGIYKKALRQENTGYLGGGMAGGILFYLVYYMFGIIGVSLVAVLIIMLGFSVILNKPIIEIFKTVFSRMRNVGKYTGNFRKFFKYEFGKPRSKEKTEKKDIFKLNKTIPLKIFEDYQNEINYNFQEKLSYELRSLIHSIFSNLHIEYKDISTIVGYNITTFKFHIFSVYDIKEIVSKLNHVIEEEILIGTDKNVLIIQVMNRHQQLLTIRNLLMKQSLLMNNYLIPIGVNYENKLIDVDFLSNAHLLIVGGKGVGIKNFITSFLLSLFVKVSLCYYTIELYDQRQEFEFLYDFVHRKEEQEVNQFLNEKMKEIDQIIEILNQNKVTSIDEYNQQIEIEKIVGTKMKHKIIIINAIEVDKDTHAYFENKLMYLTQMGEKCGYHIIYLIRDKKYISTIVLSLFSSKLIFKTEDATTSQMMLNNDNAFYLQENGDCFYVEKGKTIRLKTAYVSKKDLNSVKEFLL